MTALSDIRDHFEKNRKKYEDENEAALLPKRNWKLREITLTTADRPDILCALIEDAFHRTVVTTYLAHDEIDIEMWLSDVEMDWLTEVLRANGMGQVVTWESEPEDGEDEEWPEQYGEGWDDDEQAELPGD